MPTKFPRRPGWVAAALLLFAWTGALATDEHVLPSERCRGLWIVPVSFGEDPADTLQLVLDTGAGRTSIDPDAVLRATGRRIQPGKSIRLRDLSLGPLAIRKIKIRVHELDHIGRALGRPIDGILGFPAFNDLLLTLDYPAGEVRVASGSLPETDDRTVFRDVGRVRPYLALTVGTATVPVLIDSGSTGRLTLRESDPLHWAVEPRTVFSSVRYSRIRLDSTGRLGDDLAYGPLTLERPVVTTIADGTRLSGEKILRRFAWTFDQKRRRIRMIPDSDDPIVLSPVRGFGIAFRPLDAGLEVVRVFPGLPGAVAGMLEGDVVLSIDGTPVYERGCISIEDDDERDVSLHVVRDGREIDVIVGRTVLVP